MDSIRGLLDENTLQSIAKAAGRGVTEKQVEDVLNAVLPAIEKDSASGTLVSRTNAAVEEQQTVTRSGAEMTVEIRLDHRVNIVTDMLDIAGVYDATLVACQTEAGA